MLETLIARLGFKVGLNLSRILVVAIVLALGAFCYWRGMAAIERMVASVRAEAIAARDAHWQGEIAKSNEAVALQRLQNEHVAQQRTAVAEQKITELQASLAEMEKKNAALPNGDRCGLGRDHGRLLNP